jgi:hypothetical protein
MVCVVPGLNLDPKGSPQPVRLVVDLASFRAKNPRIIALSDHDTDVEIGYWDRFTVDAAGVEADLHLVEPKNEFEANVLKDAVRKAALIRSGVPLQASIGAETGDGGKWEPVKAGASAEVNGRTFSGDGDMPLFVLRGGSMYEASIVTFGADSETGRVAAAKQKPITPVAKEASMSDQLKALLGKTPEKFHGLVARCVAEGKDEVAITHQVHAAEIDERDTTIKALQAELDAAKAKLTEYESKGARADDYGTDPTEKKGEKDLTNQLSLAARSAAKGTKAVSGDEKKPNTGTDTPKTLTDAMRLLATKDPNLKGFALRRAARAAYPDAEEK